MAAENEVIFAEGQVACEQGVPLSGCPHPSGSEARSLWLAGWDEAQRYMERSPARGLHVASTTQAPRAN